jgi:hypothetical protein
LISASTVALSAAAIIACPHTMPPVRESCAFCGRRKVTLWSSNAWTFRPSACTQGAK